MHHTYTQESHFMYTFEEWTTYYKEYLDKIFKYDDIKNIYDIGANTGGTTAVFLQYASNNNKNIETISCFEPDKENMSYLKKQLSSFIKTGVVKCIEKGVYYGLTESEVAATNWSTNPNIGGYGVAECVKETAEQQQNLFLKGEAPHPYKCEIIPNKVFKLDTLENLCESLPDPDFIKMDIEGAEQNVIINSLKKSDIINRAKFIILEWSCVDSSLDDFVSKYLPKYDVFLRRYDPLLIKKSIKHKYI